MSRKDRVGSPLSAQEDAVIDLIADEYRPQPMDPIRQAVFRQRLSERLAERTRMRWAAGFATAAAAAAVLLFVLRTGPATTQDGVASSTDAPLLYAYVDPDEYSTETIHDYLPGDYRVIADVLDGEQRESEP